ncbi:MAG TPA: cytochrome c4 [Gammaproteobacteria bacterium]|nr:cytochrome c4 [Gammaproteobacteria bacterium]
MRGRFPFSLGGKMMQKTLQVWLVVLAMSLGVGGVAQAGTKGDPAAGEAKAGLCGGCHGFDGNSADATFPRLAGQYADYIVKQIRDFQKGLRANNDTMAGMAAMVASVQDAKDIGAYFSQQKKAKEPLAPVDKKKAKVGEKIFYEGIPEKNVYGCVNCHGERGNGKAPNVAQFPVIGGQHRDYIIKELKDFKSGLRSNDPAGMMANIAKGLSEEEMEALANYLSGLL